MALVAAMLLAVGVGVGLGWERSPAESSPTDGLGGPIVAGPATSIATTLAPTTAPATSVESSITCGGSFDRSTGHYRDNVVVYAQEPD